MGLPVVPLQVISPGMVVVVVPPVPPPQDPVGFDLQPGLLALNDWVAAWNAAVRAALQAFFAVLSAAVALHCLNVVTASCRADVFWLLQSFKHAFGFAAAFDE